MTSQIFYSRPYSFLSGQLVLFLIGITALLSSAVYGHQATISFILWMIFFNLQIANFFCNPNICINTTRTNPDGSTVRVKRPLIGFKRLEQVVDCEGEPDDGVWYGRAFLRL